MFILLYTVSCVLSLYKLVSMSYKGVIMITAVVLIVFLVQVFNQSTKVLLSRLTAKRFHFFLPNFFPRTI